ncbi:MAG: chemotaxis protein CheC [Elusimicrobiota bacterium]
MKDINRLNQLELDALKEFGNIASGNAATALSQLIGKRIDISNPSLEIVPVREAAEMMGKNEEYVAGIYFQVYGDLAGSILLTFIRDDAVNLVNMLIPHEEMNNNILSPLGESALKEAGNIIAGAYVTALSKILEKNLLLSTPSIAIDMLGAIIDFIQIEIDQVSEYVIVIKIEFFEQQESIRGNFYLLPNQQFLTNMLDAVKKLKSS